jgi:hypothetical protein
MRMSLKTLGVLDFFGEFSCKIVFRNSQLAKNLKTKVLHFLTILIPGSQPGPAAGRGGSLWQQRRRPTGR